MGHNLLSVENDDWLSCSIAPMGLLASWAAPGLNYLSHKLLGIILHLLFGK